MGNLDNHVQAQIQPLLRQGEQVQMRAHARSRGGGGTYLEWLVAVTNQRLVFFRAHQTMTLQIEPSAGEPFLLELKELEEVSVQATPGITDMRQLSFKPIPGAGPREVASGKVNPQDLPTSAEHGFAFRMDIPKQTAGLDEQERFWNSYGPWLSEQVRARALWSEADHAAYHAAVAEAAAAAERARLAEETAAAQRAEQRKDLAKKGLDRLPFIVAGIGGLLALPMLAMGVGLLVKYSGESSEIRCAEESVEMARSNRAWIATGGQPPTDCPERELAARQREDCPDFSGYPANGDYCHHCSLSPTPPTPRSTPVQVFEREGMYWVCPGDAQVMEQWVRIEEDGLDLSRTLAQNTLRDMLLFFAGGFVFLVVAVLAGGFGVMRRRKSAAAGSS